MFRRLLAPVICIIVAGWACQAHAGPPIPKAGMAGTPAFFSGERLLEICRRQNYGQCSMYVAGVVDGMFFVDGENGSQSLCRAQMTNRRAARLVTRLLEEDGALRGLSAAAAVQAAMASPLGCTSDEIASKDL